MCFTPEAVVASQSVDGILSEFSAVEAVLVSASAAGALYFALEDKRYMMSGIIWAGFGLCFVTLSLRHRLRRAALIKAGVLRPTSKTSAEDQPKGLGAAADAILSPITPLSGDEGLGEDSDDGGGDNGAAPARYSETTGQGQPDGPVKPPQRGYEVPLGCARVPEARPCGSYAEYLVVVRVPPAPSSSSSNPSASTSGGSVAQWEVWRRFSDFGRLRAALKAKGALTAKGGPPGWTPPMLPPKTLRRKLDARFLDKRRHELERFLAVLLCHPVVRKSPDLRAFLNFTPTPVGPSSPPSARSEASTSVSTSSGNKASSTSGRTGATSPARHIGGGSSSSNGDSPSTSSTTSSSASLRSLVDPFLAPFTQGDEARSGGDSTKGGSGSSVGKGAPPGATNGSSSHGSLSSLNSGSNGGSTDYGNGGGSGSGEGGGQGSSDGGGGGSSSAARPPAEEGARIDAQVDAACEEAAWEPIRGMWRDLAEENEFQVRGPFYLEDKAKVPAGPACLRLVAVLMYGCRLSGADGERIDHVASRGKCAKLVQRIGDITSKGGRPKNEPCLFIVNLQVPGTPVINLVQIFALPAKTEARLTGRDDKKFLAMFHRYYEGLAVSPPTEPHPPSTQCSPEVGTLPPDDFRNQRFKLIPRIVDGPWVVKASIPQKPALLGQKLTQRYFRGECYVETDVHVGSSIVANNVTGIGRSASTKMCMDMGYELEGRAEAELPEKLVGAGRFSWLSVDNWDTIEDE